MFQYFQMLLGLRTRLTYFWYKNEKKISLNFIFVFELLRFWHTCSSFLSKFASQIKLIQSVMGSVASLRVLGSYFRGPECQGLVSQGPRVPGPGLMVPGSWVSESQGPGCRVSSPDFRLYPFLQNTFWRLLL